MAPLCQGSATPSLDLPQTFERRCAACQSEQIAPLGHVTSYEGLVKVVHRCEACGIAFLFVRTPAA